MAEHDIEKIVEAGGEVFNFRDPTKQPVADRVTSWSSTPSDAKYPSEKLVKDSLDGIAGDYRTKDQDISKGANLVVNGSGTMMSNYNFSDCTFVADTDLPVGIAGAFHRSYNTIFHNEFIQLNTEKAFYAEAWYRVKTANKSTVRLGLACYDIDKKAITAVNICYGAGSLTELTQNLNPGDTVVHLADLSNSSWKSETTYHKGFIFWNYVNSLGYTYPPETYSRNVYPERDSSSLWEDSTKVDEVNGTITLKSPWSGPVVPAGTKVSRRSSGGAYYYISSSASAGASTEWTKLSGKFSGFASGGTALGAFKQGAAFFKLSWINDYTSGDEWIEFAGIELRELPDRISTARKLKTNLARTSDSTFDGSADQMNIPVTGTLPVANGGTGATTAIGAEYNILNQVADIETTLNVDRKIALCNQTKSASNGVFRWIKLRNVWTLFKGLLSSESGVNISGTASGLSSTLSVGRGGTGMTSVTAGNYVVGAGTSAMVEKTPKDVGSDVLSHLDTDNGNVVDDDYIVGSYHVNDTTISNNLFVRRSAVKLWNYIKSKLSGSDVNIGGNAATATKATQDSDGSAINTTYKKLAESSKFTKPQWIDDNTRTLYNDLRIGNSFKLLSLGISGTGNLLLKELAGGRTNSPNSEKSIIYTYNGGTDYFFNGKASTAGIAGALADDSGYVHKAGSETVSGSKTFTAKWVMSSSSASTYSGFLAERVATSDSNHKYGISLEINDNGKRGLYDYGSPDGYAGEGKWVLQKDASGNIRVGESSNKVYISGKCFDFSGTIGSDANTFYLG